jgi:hypothetical protein
VRNDDEAGDRRSAFRLQSNVKVRLTKAEHRCRVMRTNASGPCVAPLREFQVNRTSLFYNAFVSLSIPPGALKVEWLTLQVL